MKANKKIALIGAGQIGGTMALVLTEHQMGDIVLFDVVEGVPQGKALDLMNGRSIIHSSTSIVGTNSFEDIDGADVVIVTAGSPRKPGMTREDLLEINFDVMKSIGEELKVRTPNALVIVISNPVDILVYAMQKVTGFPSQKVIGMAGVLDSTRLACYISEELNVSAEDVHALVMGFHGDSMVGLYKACSISGIALSNFLGEGRFNELSNRTAKTGGEIVSLLKSGSAYYSPALSAIKMVSAYIQNKRSIFTAVAKLNGEYGINGLYCGVPIIMGENGVEEILEINLTDHERAIFEDSTGPISKLVAWVDEKI